MAVNPNGKIYSSKRPTLADFGVPNEIRSQFKIVNLKRCVWACVPKKGKGSMRVTLRGRSTKLKVAGKYGRKTVQIKDRVLGRLERELHPQEKKKMDEGRDCLNMSVAEAWEAFAD